MSVDLKTLTPDTTINDSAVLFGADSQASASPSVYSVGTVRGHIVATANTFTQPQIVSVNSSSDAFRVTQTGAGKALVVEDSANPDATPFVIDSNGVVGIGELSPSAYLSSGLVVKSSSAFSPQLLVWNTANDTSAPYWNTRKDRAGAIVNNGDALGTFVFAGYDGATYRNAAYINVNVDGTPGASDMPARMSFWTAADGAASPTERMRIDNAGRVGIGGVPSAGINLTVSKTITGAATSYGTAINGAVQSDVTSATAYYLSYASTAAASFTLPSLTHFSASQGTFGAGSIVANQYGFFANSNIIGATNNYGFYSNIASGTGRWNFYAGGTAPNYFAGNVGIGTSSPVSTLDVRGSLNIPYGTPLYVSRQLGPTSEGGNNSWPSGTSKLIVPEWNGANDVVNFYTPGSQSSSIKMTMISNGNIGIGTTAPSASAALDITSTTQGVLFPRMTTTQRDNISSPADGLVLYNTTTNKLQVRASGSWVDLH